MTAFTEFYRRGFQGASVNRIVEEAATTKGALFHHFNGKSELGRAVVDEILYPTVKEKWIDPLDQSDHPIETLREILTGMEANCDPETLCQGCPLNNLAQEMSPLDESFRLRLERIYSAWRDATSRAFERGMAAGNVRSDAHPQRIGAFLVACLAGTIGTAKNAQDVEIMKHCGEEIFAYLDQLRS